MSNTITNAIPFSQTLESVRAEPQPYLPLAKQKARIELGSIYSLAMHAYNKLCVGLDVEDREKFVDQFGWQIAYMRHAGFAITQYQMFTLTVAAALYNYIQVEHCNTPGATEKYQSSEVAVQQFIDQMFEGTEIEPLFDGLFAKLLIPDDLNRGHKREVCIALP